MPLEPSWSSPCSLVSSASWSASWPSSTTPPLMGLTRLLQLASSSSSPVCHLNNHWECDIHFTYLYLVILSCVGFFVLLAMAVYTGVTVNYYGKRYGSWRFSWSYIMGWVAVVLTFFSGSISYNSTFPHWILYIKLFPVSSRNLLHVCL